MLVKLSRPATVDKYGQSLHPAVSVSQCGDATPRRRRRGRRRARALAANLPVPVVPAAGPFLSKYYLSNRCPMPCKNGTPSATTPRCCWARSPPGCSS